MFIETAMKGATVIKENGKEILNGLAIHPAKTERPLNLLQKLSNAYCFYRMYHVCGDFDTALDFALSVGGSKEVFLMNLKETFFLLCKFTGYESESDTRIVKGILRLMILRDFSYKTALVEYCIETGSALKAVEKWFPFKFFRAFNDVEGYEWCFKNF